jgi:hypothetical protein
VFVCQPVSSFFFFIYFIFIILSFLSSFFIYPVSFYLFLGGFFELERGVGCEVAIKLARWQHAAGSTIAPRRFYRLAGEQI